MTSTKRKKLNPTETRLVTQILLTKA